MASDLWFGLDEPQKKGVPINHHYQVKRHHSKAIIEFQSEDSSSKTTALNVAQAFAEEFGSCLIVVNVATSFLWIATPDGRVLSIGVKKG